MSMQDLYQQIILDHARSPHGAGLRDPFDVEVHHVNPTCGDEVRLRVRLADDGGGGLVVADVSYQALGCTISIAATSVLSEQVTGAPVQVALSRYDDVLAMLRSRDGHQGDPEALGDAAAFAGVAKFPARVKCALLGWAALRDALAQAVQARDQAAPPRERVPADPTKE